MQSDLPSLLDLQHAFANALRNAGDGRASSSVTAGALAPQDRVGIYRNTSTATLVAALRLSYPAVQALVGPEFFEGTARLFIEAEPPRSAWLDAYGEGYPVFLARLPEAAAIPYVPDVARLDWAVNSVLHAPDAMPLDLGRLAELDMAVAGEICFVAHPARRPGAGACRPCIGPGQPAGAPGIRRHRRRPDPCLAMAIRRGLAGRRSTAHRTWRCLAG